MTPSDFVTEDLPSDSKARQKALTSDIRIFSSPSDEWEILSYYPCAETGKMVLDIQLKAKKVTKTFKEVRQKPIAVRPKKGDPKGTMYDCLDAKGRIIGTIWQDNWGWCCEIASGASWDHIESAESAESIAQENCRNPAVKNTWVFTELPK